MKATRFFCPTTPSSARGLHAAERRYGAPQRCRKLISLPTHCWREPDSNHRSRRERNGHGRAPKSILAFSDLTLGGSTDRADAPIGNAQQSLLQQRDRWFESGSLQRRVCLTGVFGDSRRKSPAFGRGCESGRDQRTGRAGPEPARLGCFSLTGIAAVPPREIKAQQREEPRPWPGLPLLRVALQLARRLR